MDRDRFPVVVHLLVYLEDTFALLRRANTGFMDGYYALPGGHQQQGEGVRQAMSRECTEELGIVPAVLLPVCVLPYRSGRHQGVNFVFECHEFAGEPQINEPELFDELIWVDEQNLPQPCAPWIKDALKLRGENGWYAEMEWD